MPMKLFSAALIVLVIAVAPAFGGQRVRSDVEIDNYHGEGDEVVFSGVVSSPKHACEKRRKVLVIGRDEQAGNAKRIMGRDRTGPQGRFDVREQIPFLEDYVWAKLKRARPDNGTKCKGARSKEISTAG